MGSYYTGTVTGQQLNVPNLVTAEFYGYEAMLCDPLDSVAGTAMTSQTVYMYRIPVSRTFTLTTIATLVSSAGSSFTSAFASVHGENREQIAITADLSSTWNSATTALKESPVVTPASVPGGPGRFCFVCLFAHSSSPPSLYRIAAGGSNLVTVYNLGLTGNDSRIGNGGTGATEIPATPTMTAANVPVFWVGLK